MHKEYNIKKLSDAVLKILGEKQYSVGYIDTVKHVNNQIISLHRDNKTEEINFDIINFFIDNAENENNHINGSSEYANASLKKRCAFRLVELHNTGTLSLRYIKPKRSELSSHYHNLIEFCMQNSNWTESIRNRVDSTGRNYFLWLKKNNVTDISEVDVYVLKKYLSERSGDLSGLGLTAVMYALKKLHQYLFETGYTQYTFKELLSFRISKSKKFKPALHEDEILAMLDSVNRGTVKGKRDYAILLLAYTTGLRGVDICLLKLENINWGIGEIRITQKKTAKPLALPLTEDVGKAIEDYIINGRPKCEANNIFLASKAPYRGLGKGAIRVLYESAREKAGLTKKAFDGKSFHALRRSAGKNMVIAGIPLIDIAQVLGQTHIESTGAYIPLDTEHMRDCGITLKNIEVLKQPTNICVTPLGLDFKKIETKPMETDSPRIERAVK